MYDIIIIGTGGAGCVAAIEVSKESKNILMVTKSDFYDSKTAQAQGGIQASFLEEDSPKNHFEDTMSAGDFQSNAKMVEVLSSQAKDTIKWLEKYQVEFDKKGENYILSNAAGLSYPRVLTCGGEAGTRILKPIAKVVQNLGIEILEYHGVVDIKKENNIFHIALKNKDNQIIKLESIAIVIASGGILQKDLEIGIQKDNVIESLNTLDMAHKLGLEMVNSDLMQYHPTGVIYPKNLRRTRLPEIMRGDGATLTNNQNKEFCDSLMTRSQLTDAIIQECENNNCIVSDDGYCGVWMNTQNIDTLHGKGYLANKYQKLYNLFLEHGIDISKEAVLVYPILHYSLGGIVSDEKTHTNLDGCFVAGEASWGVHGKDRLMGNSLLEIFVFGRIAGIEAMKFVHHLKKGS